MSQIERSQSYFFNMRKYHNSIKRILYNTYAKNTLNLLDLACGKCGDLDKWISNNIRNVIGYDINSKSIEECNNRINKKGKQTINVNVSVKDLSTNIIPTLIPNKMNIITSMFAFHYFFESENTFNTIITSILNNIQDNGFFMGTMFDGKYILNLINNKQSFELKDINDTIRFKIKKSNNFTNKLFGNKISVYIKDTVLDEPMDEYIVDFEKFVEIMKKNNFELIETKLFNEYYPILTPNLNEIEKQISFLNRTFIFRKNSTINSTINSTYNLIEQCVKETPYLIECNWTEPRESLLDIYKKVLDYKMNLDEDNNRKNVYKFLIDNFKNPKFIMNSNLENEYKDYYKFIIQDYLKTKNNEKNIITNLNESTESTETTENT